uniref:Protein kinase domain-containing protein n=1 Tax=Ditylenchus dipsaci TaxID=166011 RepID=A0A915DJU0_9BILA
MMAQIVLGLEALHVNKISHNDISEVNIMMVTKHMQIKIIDYGLASRKLQRELKDFNNFGSIMVELFKHRDSLKDSIQCKEFLENISITKINTITDGL